MRNDLIICLIGASCSGKSTAIQELIKKYPNINYIESYTTRPKRFENETGHHFVSYDEYLIQNKTNDVFCVGKYLDNYYWMNKSQYRNKGLSIFPIEPSGLRNIQYEVTDATVVSIYLSTTEENLRIRLCERNKKAGNLDIEHIIETDKNLFLIDNFKDLINFTVNANHSIDSTVNTIIQIINQFYKEDKK